MTEAYDPFYNVRKGGPKEKRIRRVELMGEHKPKPIYYIKVSQPLESGEITENLFRETFASVGFVADFYRPVSVQKESKEFVFVGFHDMDHVKIATQKCSLSFIGGIQVTVEEAKPWLLELYPRPK